MLVNRFDCKKKLETGETNDIKEYDKTGKIEHKCHQNVIV